jgi:hypothetical protein
MMSIQIRTIKSLISTALSLAALIVMTLGSSSAFAQLANDPALELFRIRCQIDIDVDPATGVESPKVQIQAKARADILDGQSVDFWIENVSTAAAPPSTVNTTFVEGSASADWDTFPDAADPTPVSIVAGDFVVAGESIKATAQVTDTFQAVSDVAECVDKTSAQFTQQTKGVCKLKDFNRGKCKSGDILPDGTIMPATKTKPASVALKLRP